MEDILYFDIIPIELTFLVVSNLDETSVNSFSLVDYKYRFLLVKDETWKTLFTNRFPLEYQFIINIKNIDGCSSWKDIFKTYDKGKKISDLSTQGTYSYLDNVYYFNLIYKEYPKIWLEIQDINLDHIGISGINRKDLNWYWIYRTLKDLTGNSNFVKGNYKNYDDFGIVLGLIYRRLGQSFMDAMIIYIYIYEKNSEKVISMDKLFYFFRISTDMYENIFNKDKIRLKSGYLNYGRIYEDLVNKIPGQGVDRSFALHDINIFLLDLKRKLEST